MNPPVTIVGRVGSDPDVRFTPSGVATATFSVAVNRRKKQGDEWVDDGTDWHQVVCWRDMAENVAEHIHKGDSVIVVGQQKSREFEGRDGGKRTVWEITADHVAIEVPRFKQTQQQPRATGAWSQATGGPDPWAAATDEPVF